MLIKILKPQQEILLASMLWLWAVAAIAADHPTAVLCKDALMPRAHGCAGAVIAHLDEPFDLNPYVEYIEDVDHTFSYEKLQAGEYEGLWQRNTERYFIGRNSQSRYWFRIQIHYQEDFSALEPVLYIPNHPSLLAELTLWIPDSTNSVRQFTTGSLQPFSQRDLTSHQYAFRPPLNKTSYIVVGMVDNARLVIPALLPLKLLSKQQFEATNRQNRNFIVAFHSIMIAMLLYNGFLYISLKQRVYGFYLLFLSQAILNCAFIDGSTMRWLWPDAAQLNFRLSQMNAAFVGLCYLMFVWEALDRLHFSPRLAKVFQAAFLLGVLLIVHNAFTPFQNLANALQVYAATATTLVLIAIYAAIRQRLPTANYLLVAEICIAAGSTIFMLMMNGKLPIHGLTFWPLHLGFLGEALLLSLALAERTRIFQQQAIENLQQFELLYEDSVEGLFEFNLLDNSLKCNNAMAKLFGYSSREAMMKSDDIENQTTQLWSNQEFIVPLFKNGFLTDYEMPITGDVIKKAIWVSVTMRVVNNEQGAPYSVEGSMIDITERKLKEKAEKEKLLVVTNNQARSKFFASMSHELRTPLTAILGYTEAALNPRVELEFIKTALGRIHHSGNHLLQIINDLLDLSKVEAQKLEVEQQQVYLLPLLEEVKETIEVLIKNKNLNFTVALCFPLPKIITSDATRIMQVLINLCSNAIKFTDRGSVTLAVRCEKEKQTLIFTIKDTGIGLHPEQVNNLFDIFSQINPVSQAESAAQADSASLRNYVGAGLGLHLAKQLAHKLGGDITVDSIFGKGSTFNFTVATSSLDNCEWLYQQPNESVIPHARVSIPSLSGSVLYAEDNEDNQRLVKNIVERTGAEITIVSNGKRALELCNAKTFDLVLTDVRIPMINGVVLTKLLLENNPRLPVVAITATLMDAEIEEFKKVGFKRILRKPIDRQAIYEIMQVYLSAAKKTIPPSVTSLPLATKPIRILLAEDNLDNQGLIALYIKKAKADVVIVETGADALEKASTQNFDLILMDMQMPVMDGMTAVRWLRAGGFNKPIYALTANDTNEAIEECKSAGCDGHLSKPLNTVRLTELINEVAKRCAN